MFVLMGLQFFEHPLLSLEITNWERKREPPAENSLSISPQEAHEMAGGDGADIPTAMPGH